MSITAYTDFFLYIYKSIGKIICTIMITVSLGQLQTQLILEIYLPKHYQFQLLSS